MNSLDAQIINTLQEGLPITERPFADAAQTLDLDENQIVARLAELLERGLLSRFGPLFNADKLGGGYSLCALAAPADTFDRVASLVNDHPEVAHNYARDHALNMWFVIATETEEDIPKVIAAIEEETGLEVFDFPKEAEYFVGLRLTAEQR